MTGLTSDQPAFIKQRTNYSEQKHYRKNIIEKTYLKSNKQLIHLPSLPAHLPYGDSGKFQNTSGPSPGAVPLAYSLISVIGLMMSNFFLYGRVRNLIQFTIQFSRLFDQGQINMCCLPRGLSFSRSVTCRRDLH